MSRPPKLVLATADAGLLAHWQAALGNAGAVSVANFQDLQHLFLVATSMVWLDLALPDTPKFDHPGWAVFLKAPNPRVVAASSNPKDAEAMQALDAGCAGYCHAFSDTATLRQVKQVVEAGYVWIGKTLMQRLVQSASEVARVTASDNEEWHKGLTEREQEVSVLAANGASNSEIARNCKISERTVKAHLSATFTKLNLTDRLQLALRVHGIS